ncbi:interferon-inducible double-stranded RNA-dependent protein kinase activator A homolog [Hyposmocoma kahamanoa]|uniref:interferon-inducible double-stranded RNA-dependent protein kinase activator A homolog n=1 Tax=Hyposmocoma kahamanoa TaxID=1477025 RepID=UPI000E6D7B35|nr:interferon-inducible double-stranded RNA-dependent protein kinase activator A homolog [Hyposmocoma kahamanoa]XP_026326645.1 interferon-inducible double-stranded RNA-dependent protein kinase activator A homolog [Hyposmocoma kahamanoa]XP_026326646.1 interferon-inducible double-stranded RNA-dependent protein kinase activator A homolog [Hyposmocoma kahamanoa]
MKTAVTALQEMMVKLKEIPEYECISQSGPQHLATFEYRCSVRGCVVKASARSKKEAKQEVARVMLLALKARGEDVPPPFDRPPLQPPPGAAEPAPAPTSGPGPRSYVALLKELCEEYHLPGVEYELVSDTGPPHMRQFAVRARLGQHSRLAASTTKKAARQLAAQQLYSYLRDNLSRLTTDFVEVNR